MNLPLICYECVIKWAMRERGKIGYWVGASDILSRFPVSCVPDQAARALANPGQEGRKQNRFYFQLWGSEGMGHRTHLICC